MKGELKKYSAIMVILIVYPKSRGPRVVPTPSTVAGLRVETLAYRLTVTVSSLQICCVTSQWDGTHSNVLGLLLCKYVTKCTLSFKICSTLIFVGLYYLVKCQFLNTGIVTLTR